MSDNEKLNAIDAAIAKAKEKAAARKASKGDATPAPVKGSSKEKKSTAKATSETDKEAKKAEREKERAEQKAKRDAEREAKKAEKAAAKNGKKPAHMSKVEKAAEKLPALNDDAKLIFSDATSNLSAAQIAAIALHLQHFNRVKATERALNAKIEEGLEVEIIGGDPRFIGKVGIVAKAGRLRCHVEVEGLDKNVYCFTSDVAPVHHEVEKSTGTDG